ncbi:MAG: type IV toxin-antitoxin system AbiEi family antitoxin domain-containing protein [Rhizomicrobium sp.]
MEFQYNSALKTMGTRAAQLITELNERRRSTITLADVESITGLPQATARSLVSKVRRRGLVTRLKPGLYSLVPFELGRATEHVGDPYLLAEDIIGDQAHYLSHASALELHRMVTQPTSRSTLRASIPYGRRLWVATTIASSASRHSRYSA